jgi:hypothetical protein
MTFRPALTGKPLVLRSRPIYSSTSTRLAVRVLVPVSLVGLGDRRLAKQRLLVRLSLQLVTIGPLAITGRSLAITGRFLAITGRFLAITGRFLAITGAASSRSDAARARASAASA